MDRDNPMMRPLLTLFALLLLSGCADDSPDTGTAPEMPRFDTEHLVKGRNVWMGTCRNCHLLGVSGAPAVTDISAWRPRMEKQLSALYSSALQGIRGEDDKFRMPPRGGNQRLSPEEVRQAVDYMLASVQALSASNSVSE